MNRFLTDEFQISKIALCILVKQGTGQLVHKNRPSHGLVFQITGKKRYVFDNGDTLTVKEGDVFYLPIASTYIVENIADGDCMAVNFELFDASITYDPFVFSFMLGEQFQQKFKTIVDAWTAKKPGFQTKCFSLLYDIIYNIQKESNKVYTAPSAKKIAIAAREYINKNLSDQELTVEKIATRFEISPEYFRRLFKDVYGSSPKQFIIKARMEYAAELILSGEFSISNICHMCGYDNESYFSTEFKRFYHIQPSQYAPKQHGQ